MDERKNGISDVIDGIIKEAIDNYDNSYSCDSPFEKLISMGELVDRLSIVNFKLFTLKDLAIVRGETDKEFCAWAAVEDVKLVEERARLKKCIDEKLVSTIKKIQNGDVNGGFNPEVKKYGH